MAAVLPLVCLSLVPGMTALRVPNGVPNHAPQQPPNQPQRSVSTRATTVEEPPRTNPRTEGLGFALDDGTRNVHSIAENTGFVTGFFRGLARRESFAQLTSSLYFVYQAMETILDETTNDHLLALDFPELRRLPSLERDMQFFFGDDWRQTVEPSPATRAYVDRIRAVARSSTPELLVGHLYSRYLGDLFGGAMLANMASKSLDLDDGGLDFYTFETIPDTRTFIDSWYIQLNDLDLDPRLQAAIVDEATDVFRLNIAIFNELEGSAVRALATIALQTLVDKFRTLFR